MDSQPQSHPRPAFNSIGKMDRRQVDEALAWLRKGPPVVNPRPPKPCPLGRLILRHNPHAPVYDSQTIVNDPHLGYLQTLLNEESNSDFASEPALFRQPPHLSMAFTTMFAVSAYSRLWYRRYSEPSFTDSRLSYKPSSNRGFQSGVFRPSSSSKGRRKAGTRSSRQRRPPMQNCGRYKESLSPNSSGNSATRIREPFFYQILAAHAWPPLRDLFSNPQNYAAGSTKL